MKRARDEEPVQEAAIAAPARIELGDGAWIERARFGGALDFEALWALRPAQVGQVCMFGKLVPTPRWQQTYGERAYRFSGVAHAAVPMPPMIAELLAHANAACAHALPREWRFNMALVNWYADGTHYIGWHADSEAQLRHDARGDTLVYSLSFGATRDFALRRTRDGATTRLALAHADALLMGGACQRTHKHAVPRVSGAKGAAIGRRVNVTFRVFK